MRRERIGKGNTVASSGEINGLVEANGVMFSGWWPWAEMEGSIFPAKIIRSLSSKSSLISPGADLSH